MMFAPLASSPLLASPAQVSPSASTLGCALLFVAGAATGLLADRLLKSLAPRICFGRYASATRTAAAADLVGLRTELIGQQDLLAAHNAYLVSINWPASRPEAGRVMLTNSITRLTAEIETATAAAR